MHAAGGAGAATTGGEADADAGEGGDSDGTGDADADAGGGSETKRVVTAKQVKKLAKKISKIAAVVDTADEESGAGASAAALFLGCAFVFSFLCCVSVGWAFNFLFQLFHFFIFEIFSEVRDEICL